MGLLEVRLGSTGQLAEIDRELGTDKLSRPGQKTPLAFPVSGSLRRGRSRGFGMTSQYAQARSGDQMGLEVEGVVDWTVAGEEPLG